MFKKIALSLALTVGAISHASAAIITYTDRVAWETALTGSTIIVENFEGAASDFGPNSSGNIIGSLTVDIIGHDGDSSRQGLTGDGFFAGEVDSSNPVTDDGASIRFNAPAIGFALVGLQDDNSSPNLDLEEIGVDILGTKFLISDILGLTDPNAPGTVSSVSGTAPFVGFISDTVFTNFSLIHGDLVREVSGSNEQFWLDGLEYAAEVPIPAPLSLLGLGLVAIGLTRKRKSA